MISSIVLSTATWISLIDSSSSVNFSCKSFKVSSLDSANVSNLIISSFAKEICSLAISSSSCKAFNSFSVWILSFFLEIDSNLDFNSDKWILFLVLFDLISSTSK